MNCIICQVQKFTRLIMPLSDVVEVLEEFRLLDTPGWICSAANRLCAVTWWILWHSPIEWLLH